MSEVEIRAFPTSVRNEGTSAVTGFDGDTVEPGTTNYYPGMSLRDYFAAKAIPGLIDARRPFAAGGPAGSAHVSPAMVAKEAYAMADAMLAERAK